MSNWFCLELDTTPPAIEIFVPPYISFDKPMPISIVSNELLLDFQEFYIVDAEGYRHDIILNLNDDHFSGTTQLNDFVVGVATIYCRVLDVVGNASNLVSKPFNVITANIINSSLRDYTLNLITVNTLNAGGVSNMKLNDCKIKVYTMAVKLNG